MFKPIKQSFYSFSLLYSSNVKSIQKTIVLNPAMVFLC
jgi:hypothetical protein